MINLESKLDDFIESLLHNTDIMLLENIITHKSDKSIIESETTLFCDTHEILLQCQLPTCLYDAKYKEHLKPAMDLILKNYLIYDLDNLDYCTHNVKITKKKIG